jgi:soluble lytic murein transglycosylase-like protein
MRGVPLLSVSLAVMAAYASNQSLQSSARVAAMARGVSPEVFLAVIQVESTWQPRLRGKDGEYGLGQIKCETAKSMGLQGPCSVLLDPLINLDLSAKYLAHQIAQNPNNLCAGISGYNTGNPRVCTGYGRRVLAIAKQGA